MTDFWTTAQTTSADLQAAASSILPSDFTLTWDSWATTGMVAAFADEGINAQIKNLSQKFTETLTNPAAAEKLAMDLARVASSGVAGLEQYPATSMARTVVQDILKGVAQSCNELIQRIQQATANSGLMEPTWRNLAEVDGGAAKLASNMAMMAGGLLSAVQIIHTAVTTGNPDAVGEKTLGAIAGIAGGAAAAALVAGAIGISAPALLTAALVGAAGGLAGWVAGAAGELAYRNSPFLQSAVDGFGKAGSWWGSIFYDFTQDIGSKLSKIDDLIRNSSTYRIIYYYDPLVLDLNGNGIETVAANGLAGAMFDQNNDGIRTATGWIGSNDGILVRDVNGNGSIDNGTEVFGDSTALVNGSTANNGFAALSDMDSNGDGVVDAQDANFAQLQVWRDLNQDGVSDAGELFTLQSLGIQSLNTAITSTPNAALAGGIQAQTSSFTRTDGTTSTMADINFTQDTFHSRYIDQIAVPVALQALPNLTGVGKLRDLQQAAALSPALADMLGRYTMATTLKERKALVSEVLIEWAKTDPQFFTGGEVRLHARYQSYSASSSNIIYVRAGFTFSFPANDVGVVASTEIKNMVRTIDAIRGTAPTTDIYSGTTGNPAQAYIDAFDSIVASFDQGLEQVRLQPLFDQISIKIDSSGLSLDLSGVQAMLESRIALSSPSGVSDLFSFNKAAETQGWLKNTDWASRSLALLDSAVTSSTITSAMTSASANTPLSPLSASSALISTASSVLTSTSANSALTSASASSILTPISTISPITSTSVSSELLAVLQDNYSNIVVLQSGVNTNGTAQSELIIGTDQNDILNNGGGNDTILAGAGDDIINVGTGNDTISGGSGNDIITDTGGTNLIDAGTGDDTINAGTGNDTINGGSGNDIITDTGGTNLIDAGTGDDIVTASGSNTIYAGDGNDTVTADGSNTICGGAGNDSITVNYVGANRLDGGAGDDLLKVTHNAANGLDAGFYNESTLFIGGTGNDRMEGSSGADTYLFNRGDGQDTILDKGTNAYARYGWSCYVKSDTIQFGAGITAADLGISRSGDNLLLKINDPNNPAASDQLTVENWFVSSAYRIESFKFADGTSLGINDIHRPLTVGTEGNDLIQGWLNESLTYDGLGGDDTINAGTGNDTINGGSGNDIITDTGGTNQIDAGTGDDIIIASGSNTIYAGDGNDTVIADGDNTIYGGAGNDGITVNYVGANRLDGGSGDDLLKVTHNAANGFDAGFYNESTLFIGGTGNDRMEGSSGADTYLFNRGDGQDTILDKGMNAYAMYGWSCYVKSDTIQFGAGITAADLGISRSGDNLLLKINDPNNPAASDQLTVENWFVSSAYRIESFKFADGTSLGINDI